MGRARRVVAALTLAAFMPGCASTKAYFADRGRDAADIFSASVGTGFGAKARASFLSLGLLREESMAGLRGGSLFKGKPGDYGYDMQFLCWNNEFFAPPGSDVRNKCFRVKQYYDMLEGGSSPDMVWCLMPPFCLSPIVPIPPEVTPSRIHYWTNIEVVAALGLSVRLGANPGELLDFILGWARVDFMKDDVVMKRLNEKKTPPP
jgi:hypothetical protein